MRVSVAAKSCRCQLWRASLRVNLNLDGHEEMIMMMMMMVMMKMTMSCTVAHWVVDWTQVHSLRRTLVHTLDLHIHTCLGTQIIHDAPQSFRE